MKIRPCIDIHNGLVKQIVGGSLKDEGNGVQENFTSAHDAGWYADIYKSRGLDGGHIILLNSAAAEPEAYAADLRQAMSALRVFPGGMQIGGGVTDENAEALLDAGASHVIVTSYVFRDGMLDSGRLERLVSLIGKERLVLDLSCRRVADQSGQVRYLVVTDRWQKFTQMEITENTLDELAGSCDEFLIHAADVEGKKSGIEIPLVELLGRWQERRRSQKSPFAVTYAGGVHDMNDLSLISSCAGGSLDVTVGSALDLFGGPLSLDALVQRARLLDESARTKK